MVEERWSRVKRHPDEKGNLREKRLADVSTVAPSVLFVCGCSGSLGYARAGSTSSSSRLFLAKHTMIQVVRALLCSVVQFGWE